ncbi:MAG: outer membrane beta-barrel protein [Prevotellaceae bacterium]|jgi:hypothetical protein|nr:outer membrane beta-barrel protein [Prevotellaceae bacterium]
MKKIILSAILTMAILFSANAQDYKWFIGGKAGFASGKQGNVKTTYFTFAPEVGYRFSDKFALASYFEYRSLTENNNGSKAKLKGTVIGPYLRYTFLKSGIVNVFIDGCATFGLSDLKGFEAGLRPGVAIDLTKRLSVVANIGFMGYNDGKGVGRNRYGKGFNIDLSGYQSSIGFYLSI